MSAAVQSVTVAQPVGQYRRVTIESAREISREVGALIHWRPFNVEEDEQFAEVLG